MRPRASGLSVLAQGLIPGHRENAAPDTTHQGYLLTESMLFLKRCVLALAVCTLPIAGCSGGSSNTATKPTAPATAPADTAAATEAIKKDYSDFFGATVPYSEKAKLLEDGATLTAALDLASKNPAAKLTSANVTSVTFTGPAAANVKYDLLVSGAKVLPAAAGTAVLQDGTWKVSKATFCQLQKIGAAGKAVPGCP